MANAILSHGTNSQAHSRRLIAAGTRAKFPSQKGGARPQRLISPRAINVMLANAFPSVWYKLNRATVLITITITDWGWIEQTKDAEHAPRDSGRQSYLVDSLDCHYVRSRNRICQELSRMLRERQHAYPACLSCGSSRRHK